MGHTLSPQSTRSSRFSANLGAEVLLSGSIRALYVVLQEKWNILDKSQPFLRPKKARRLICSYARALEGVPPDSNHHAELEQVSLENVLLLLLQLLHVPGHRGESAGEPVASLTGEPDQRVGSQLRRFGQEDLSLWGMFKASSVLTPPG
jgi:hypothetical protein